MFKSTACGRITSTSKPTFVVNIVSASRDVDGESGRGEARRGEERISANTIRAYVNWKLEENCSTWNFIFDLVFVVFGYWERDLVSYLNSWIRSCYANRDILLRCIHTYWRRVIRDVRCAQSQPVISWHLSNLFQWPFLHIWAHFVTPTINIFNWFVDVRERLSAEHKQVPATVIIKICCEMNERNNKWKSI